jgi:Protein of unknown function (DUF2726)
MIGNGFIFLGLTLLFATIVAVVLLAMQRKRGEEETVASGFKMKKPLSEPEQILYFRLSKALPECEVLAQVTFSRFLDVVEPDAKKYFGALQTINKKSADFLVCLKDFTIVAAVELDDRSHNRALDEKRDAILAKAGIKVLRWNVKEMPSEEQIRQAFL